MPACDKCVVVKEWLKGNNKEFIEETFDTFVQLGFIMNNEFGSPPILAKDGLLLTAENLFGRDNQLREDIILLINRDYTAKRIINKYLGYVECPLCGLMGKLRARRVKRSLPTFYAYIEHIKIIGGVTKNLGNCYLGKIIGGAYVVLLNGGSYRIDNRKTGRKVGRRTKEEMRDVKNES